MVSYCWGKVLNMFTMWQPKINKSHTRQRHRRVPVAGRQADAGALWDSRGHKPPHCSRQLKHRSSHTVYQAKQRIQPSHRISK